MLQDVHLQYLDESEAPSQSPLDAQFSGLLNNFKNILDAEKKQMHKEKEEFALARKVFASGYRKQQN